MMPDHPRISIDPKVLVGKPVIRGTRLSVEFIIGLLEDGSTEADIFENYPRVTHEDILACLAYARDVFE
jgi:uncharacterized protein (DUF433 family)